ncbi:MAG: hypothetical protein ABIP06_14040 [Pyrinomonadaceae bacterium]
MINQSILNTVRNGVCAIGYLAISEDEYKKDPTDRDHFRIAGSGFLVRENTVITNRHVIERIKTKLKNVDLVADDRIKVQFTYFAEDALEICNDPSAIFTSQEIAMFGFPGGNDLFVNKQVDSQLICRFGPVLQRGYISALAPFERPPISRILSDI